MKRSWLAILLVLGSVLGLVLPCLAETDEPMKPHGGISSASAFDVRIHLVYRSHEPDHQVDAESDWVGVVEQIVDDACSWNGEMKVRANSRRVMTQRGDHVDTWSASAQGSDDQPMSLTFFEDGTYEFGFGYADVPGTQTLSCTAGTCECDPEVQETYSQELNIRLPLPRTGTSLAGSQTFDSSWNNRSTSPIPATTRFTVTWSFAPVGQRPQLKAVPKVASSVTRGEPVTLDGTASTGQIQDYKWTFSGGKAAPDGSKPNLAAELHGAKVQVVLLEGMQVKLTVSDGHKTDSKAVSVAVKPRTSFETKVSQVPGEKPWEVPAPMLGGARWFGGENVCAYDPPANFDAPTHVLHPQSEGYAVAQVSDEGPYKGYTYVSEWRIEVKREAYINKWVLENAPPILRTLSENFYQANVRLKTGVVAYLAAARKHEKMHTQLMERSIRAADPAKAAEKTYGKEEAYVRQQVDKKIDEAEKAASRASQDPLPKTWSGKLAVPTPDTGEWTLIDTDV